jgi:hypothetical protein
MIKHLNRIYKLGYDIEVIWNKQIQITYDFNRVSGFEDYDPVSVLIYVHDFWDESLNFQKCLEETCEIFYSWYSDNHKTILKYLENPQDKFETQARHFSSRTNIDSLSLGDVSQQVNRGMRIDDILDDY